MVALIVLIIVLLAAQTHLLKHNKVYEGDIFSAKCPIKRITDHLFKDTRKTLHAVKDLKNKLIGELYPGGKKKKNNCPLATAYIDSAEKIQKFKISTRMAFDSQVLGQYLEVLSQIQKTEANMVREKTFVKDIEKVIMRLGIHNYRLEKYRHDLERPPCFEKKAEINLWRRFAPVYPTAKPNLCNQNKDDEILTIVQDVETIFRIRKSWFFELGKRND